MLSKLNLFSLTLISILGFESYQYHKIDNLHTQATEVLNKENQEISKSNLALENLRFSTKDLTSTEKEKKQIEYLQSIVSSPNSTISDYSRASLVLSELLYSDKFLNLQKRFDSKDLSEETNSKNLSENDKKYLELLVLNNELDEKFKSSLKSYQNGEINKILLGYNNNASYVKKLSFDYFKSLNTQYNKMIDEYKTQYIMISPDYFDYLVEHFKKNKTFTKQDYYSIIKNQMLDNTVEKTSDKK